MSNNERRLKIWANMTPAQRDYDRYMGKIPYGASWQCETLEGELAVAQRQEAKGLSTYEPLAGCSCHINPPCSYCVDYSNDEEA